MAGSNAQDLLNWQCILTWATEKEPGTVLGESCTNSSCPLAEYLNEQTGITWSVGPSIRPAGAAKKDRLGKPEWVKLLIEQIDQATRNKSGQVTRELFLKVLAQVKEDV